jgi:hypothetical protein
MDEVAYIKLMHSLKKVDSYARTQYTSTQALKKEVEVQKVNVSAALATANTAHQTATTVLNDTSGISESLEDHNTDIANLTGSLDTQIALINTNTLGINQILQTTETILTDVSSQSDGLAAAQAQLDINTSNVSSLIVDVSTNVSDIDTMETEVGNLTESVGVLTTTQNQLVLDLGTTDTNVQAIDTRVNSVELELDGLPAIVSDISTLQRYNTALNLSTRTAFVYFNITVPTLLIVQGEGSGLHTIYNGRTSGQGGGFMKGGQYDMRLGMSMTTVLSPHFYIVTDEDDVAMGMLYKIHITINDIPNDKTVTLNVNTNYGTVGTRTVTTIGNRAVMHSCCYLTYGTSQLTVELIPSLNFGICEIDAVIEYIPWRNQATGNFIIESV